MQAVLCFAAAFVAIVLYQGQSVTKYVVGVAAAMIGASLWMQDKQQRAVNAARQAHIDALETDDDEKEEDDDEDDEEESAR